MAFRQSLLNAMKIFMVSHFLYFPDNLNLTIIFAQNFSLINLVLFHPQICLFSFDLFTKIKVSVIFQVYLKGHFYFCLDYSLKFLVWLDIISFMFMLSRVFIESLFWMINRSDISWCLGCPNYYSIVRFLINLLHCYLFSANYFISQVCWLKMVCLFFLTIKWHFLQFIYLPFVLMIIKFYF